MEFTEFNHLKHRLEIGDGLTPAEFRSLVGECGGCNRFMLIRSKEYHLCPGKGATPTFAPEDRLFRLLDCTAGGEGITKFQFYDLFISCSRCMRIFTRVPAVHHSHVDT